MPNIGIIINAGSGNSEAAGMVPAILAAFSQHRIIPQVKLAHAATDIAGVVVALLDQGCDTMVVVGGDGTLSTVARELAGKEAALGVIPAGTYNHFAKDLNIPLELEAAIAVIVRRAVRRVDLGQVNGRPFINNSSLGIYPHVIFHKERYRMFGGSKLRALVRGAWVVFSAPRHLTVKITTDRGMTETRAPLIFIGNNRYGVSGLDFGGRRSLSEGALYLAIPHYAGRWRMLHMLLQAAVGQLRQQPDFDSHMVTRILVETDKPVLRVSVDGEVAVMKTPLRYEIMPGALQVIIPATP